MPAAKVYLIDEMETLKGHCRERKQKQNSTSVQLNLNQCASVIAKKTAPKYVLRMMSSINFDNIFGNTNASNELKENEEDAGMYNIDDSEVGGCGAVSPATMATAVEETAKQFVNNIQSAEQVGHVADKLTCKKVDIEGLIRDKDLNSNTIDRKFSVHEHIKLKNETPAFRYLSHYFGSGSSLRVPLGNEFPQTLKVADGRKPEKSSKRRDTKSRGSGMIIYINPDFACEDSCTLAITGTLPRPSSERHLEGISVTYKTTFWSNGDTNGLELTSRSNLTGSLAIFGGGVPAKEGRHRRKSMPGWNGRAPMWVPFDECECTIVLSTPATLTHNNQEDREEEPQSSQRLGLNTSYNSTYNFQNTFGARNDSTSPALSLSCAEASPYDTKRATHSFNQSSSARMRMDGNIVYLTAFACNTPEVAIDKLSTLSRKFQNKVTGGTTLHGNMPALSLACLHGNIIAARKLLRAGADPNRVAVCTGTTPLHDALVGGYHEVMQLLLEHRAKQTHCDDKGMTPLHVCCVNNDVKGARVLLQHKDARKALVIRDRQDRTPRMACSRKHLQDVIERECKRHGVKEKRASPWWSNLAGSAGDRPAGLKKSTAEDFMKMAVLVAKHKKGGESPPKSRKIVL